METRVTPKRDARKLDKDLTATSRLIEGPLHDSHGYGLICHFIKQKEAAPRSAIGIVMEHERDFALREKVRCEALSISKVRHKHKKLVGIDAAASELDSRPEVFAQGFRYLRNENLRFTYHAGEDFFDIADGLRTIDEAVNFFGMHSGDRIGHGTALGIDVRRFYEACHRSIAIPAQILLDNLAWLYARSYQLNGAVEESMRHRIAEEFALRFSEVYGAEASPPSPDAYYMSMCLRGDNPDAYDTTALRHVNPIDTVDSWHRCDLVSGETLDAYRNNPTVVNLYWRYHYDKIVSDNGTRMVEFRITEPYMRLIAEMQTKMTEYLGQLRIAIECCPTSNLKISKLGRYDSHPVLALAGPSERLEVRPAATINTDDLGIFCTSLDNEYNLIAAAMLKKTDADGRHLYSHTDVHATIESLIRNGHIYAFPVDE